MLIIYGQTEIILSKCGMGNKLIDSKRNNSDIETYRAELNLFVTLNEKQDLKAKVYLFDSERGLPGE